jgi:DNA-binding MarR family transcriptional regulator
MRTKRILIELVELIAQFENQSPKDKELNTTDFIGYLNAQFKPEAVKRNAMSGGRDEFLNTDSSDNRVETDISILVSVLFRYAKMYTKKALKESNIKTVDEFSFLITLMTHSEMTKQELINLQIMEKTSGIEIINRLIRQEFIEQFDDEKDKRSKLLRITETGRRELMMILPRMNMVSKIVVGTLTKEEQNILTYLLRKLDHFHNDIYMHDKEKELEMIVLKTKNPRN